MDLAGKNYWNSVYSNNNCDFISSWTPRSYLELVIARNLEEVIVKFKPQSILEIGCGNSFWLVYLNKKYGVRVAGLDYSEEGCDLVRKRLIAANVEGVIFCDDFFNENLNVVGKYDLVLSLGVIEHFSNTLFALKNISKYVHEGGVLFTEIPNFHFSIYYFLCKIWQPNQLNKHNLFNLKMLMKYYKQLNYVNVDGRYIGCFSLDLIPWNLEPRFPLLSIRLYYRLRKLTKGIDRFNISRSNYNPYFKFLSPFFFVIGIKKCAES